jgi:hypothetical protein
MGDDGTSGSHAEYNVFWLFESGGQDSRIWMVEEIGYLT